MKVLLLCGSVGKESCTRAFLRYLEAELQTKGAETIFWDLGEKPLPIAVPEFHNRAEENPSSRVREFYKAVKKSDGIVLGSPLYHGSYSGVLKNALDNLPPLGFYHKPVALVSHSSNVRSCVIPCDNLRPVVRSLGGYSAQMQIGTTDDDFKVSKGILELTNPKIKERADELLNELINLSITFMVRR